MSQTLTQPVLRKPLEADGSLEKFYYDDAIVRKFLVMMFVWGAVAMLVGLYVALDMVFPWLNFGQRFLTFGRLRPLHTNA
ncbi:MAG TPA: hypothetical protein VL992_13430, partial [Tepidisphaeraceae bacterium]|nr:hypothetical protein [Tepidisphaeraceae bacterium]HUB26422.1 hypothetical protein [Tepidisphaeraceae bacterium]